MFRYLLLSLFFSLYVEASCNPSLSESHVQDCESHTIDVESHDSVCCGNEPIANYHFDECQWDGIAGEIIDQSGNFNAISNEASLTTGQINNGGSFDGTDDYIDIGDNLDPGNSEWSISVWFKCSSTNGENIIYNKENLYEAAVRSGYFQYAWKPHWNWDGGHSFPVTQGEWTHALITYDGNNQKVYKNGNKVYERDQTGNIGSNDNKFLIGARGSNSPYNFFNGDIDEIKVFDKALIASQIQDIYTNESTHKNHDGSHRMAIDCTPPKLLAEYRFDECKYTGDTGEVIDSESGDSNGTITGVVSISKYEKKIGHALKLNGGAVNINDLDITTETYKKHTVSFWMYWNGTDAVMPFGWMFYDLFINGTNIGFNTGAGDLYGTSANSLENSWHYITAIFTNGDVHSNRFYIDGVLQTLTQISGTPNNAKIATTNVRIGDWRYDNASYRFKSYLDELKIYKGELSQSAIQAEYNNVIDRDIICSQAIFNAVNKSGGCFNWNNNITTKIAGDAINLTVLSADENDNNTSLIDTNLTKLELLSFSDAGCSILYDTTEIWSGNEDINSSACYNLASFTHNKAVKCAKIKITGTYDGNTIESNATDTFSIRPDKFILANIPATNLTAEHNYTFRANAVNFDGTTQTLDYNRSIAPVSQKYLKNNTDGSAMGGTFSPTAAFVFTDGASPDTTLSFDNVGKIGLELNDTVWAEVDNDDTTLENRIIYLEQNLTFIPNRFDINFTTTPTMNNHNSGLFTYYADDFANMGAELENLNFTITALGENNGTMTNYQNPQATYYANDINITPSLSLPNSPNTSTTPQSKTDFDATFASGVANIAYTDVNFNYDRNHSKPVNPQTIQGSDANYSIDIIEANSNAIEGNITTNFDDNATFYYGRVKTNDIRTSQTPIDAEVEVLIYSTNPMSGFKKRSSSWYTNKKDNLSIIGQRAEQKRKLTATSVNNITIPNGTQNFNIIANPSDKSHKKYYHLDINPWLWYSRYTDYNFTANSTCGTHPCFEYIFEVANNTTGIKNGDFNSTKFENNFKSGIKKKAIKIMR